MKKSEGAKNEEVKAESMDVLKALMKVIAIHYPYDVALDMLKSAYAECVLGDCVLPGEGYDY